MARNRYNLPVEIVRKTLADSCQRNFYQFSKWAFGIARNPRGYWFTRSFHKPICDLLQKQANLWLENRRKKHQGRSKVMVVVPRGMGKTVTVTKAFPMWLQLQDVDLCCVIDSESTSKSEDFLSSIKTIYEGGDPYALFTWLYGSWKHPDRMWRDSKFTHAMRRQMSLTEPSFNSTSVEKGATGFHPDLLIIDDLISQERIRDQGNWIQNSVNHVNALIPALRTDSFQLVVGTPYTNDDVINTLLTQDGIKELHGMPIPDPFPQPSESGQWVVYFMQARKPDGSSVLPEAWSDLELDDYETKRPMDFAAQMMCTPGTGGHMPITSEFVENLWVNPQSVPSNLTIGFFCDTAFKSPKRMAKGDESVIEVWGYSRGGNSGDVYYLEGWGSNSWRVEGFAEKLVQLVQHYKAAGYRIRAIVDERTVGGKEGTWEAYLRNVFADAGMFMPPLLMLTRQHTRKVERISEAAAYWVDGRVRLVRHAPGVRQLVKQMLQIGVSAHDDWADAAADVFNSEIYVPQIVADAIEISDPRGPYDDYLKTGSVDDGSARSMYDAYFDEHEEQEEGWEAETTGWR